MKLNLKRVREAVSFSRIERLMKHTTTTIINAGNVWLRPIANKNHCKILRGVCLLQPSAIDNTSKTDNTLQNKTAGPSNGPFAQITQRSLETLIPECAFTLGSCKSIEGN